MIKKNNKTISSVIKGSQVIDKITKGTLLVFEAFKNLVINGVSPLTLRNCKGVDLVDYKIYGKNVQDGNTRNLPSEYKEVSYIESTGTQYIDTGIIPNQNTGFDIVYLSKDVIGMSDYGCILGARHSSLQREFQLTTYSGNVNAYLGTLRYGTSNYNAGITVNKKMRSTLINKVYTNNKELLTSVSGTFTSPTSITIFALNNNGTITQNGNVELYSLKLYDGETLVRDFVPCYRISDDVIGLYDLVEGKFYTNVGTGEFIKSTDIPTTETPIDIESVGDYDWFTKKYKIPVKITGKNLFNLEEFLNTPATNNKINYRMALKPNTTYTASTVGLTGSMSGPPSGNRYLFVDDIPIFDGKSQTFVTDETGYIEIKLNVNDSAAEPLLNGTAVVQLEQNTYPTDYEPYVEQITNIFLDEPLRKISSFADYIDFKNKKVVRRIYSEVLTTVHSKSSTTDVYSVFLTNVNKKPYLTGSSGTKRVGYAQSNKFIQHTGNYGALTDYGGYIQSYMTNSGGYRIVYTFDDVNINTVALAQEKIEDGFEVQYVLETAIEETIELPNIPTLKGTTILNVDTETQPSNMEIIYKGK